MMHPCAVLVNHYRRYMEQDGAIDARVQVPYSFDEVWLSPDAAVEMWNYDTCLCHVTIKSVETSMTVFDCLLLTEENNPIMYMKGVYTRSLSQEGYVLDSIVEHTKQLISTWQPAPVLQETSSMKDWKNTLVLYADFQLPVWLETGTVMQDATIMQLTEWLQHCDDESGVTSHYHSIVVILPTSFIDSSDEILESSAVATWLRTIKQCCRRTKTILFLTPIITENLTMKVLNNSLSGALLCAQQEYPDVTIKQVALENLTNGVDIMKTELLSNVSEPEVRYTIDADGVDTRLVRRYQESVPLTLSLIHI